MITAQMIQQAMLAGKRIKLESMSKVQLALFLLEIRGL